MLPVRASRVLSALGWVVMLAGCTPAVGAPPSVPSVPSTPGPTNSGCAGLAGLTTVCGVKFASTKISGGPELPRDQGRLVVFFESLPEDQEHDGGAYLGVQMGVFAYTPVRVGDTVITPLGEATESTNGVGDRDVLRRDEWVRSKFLSRAVNYVLSPDGRTLSLSNGAGTIRLERT